MDIQERIEQLLNACEQRLALIEGARADALERSKGGRCPNLPYFYDRARCEAFARSTSIPYGAPCLNGIETDDVRNALVQARARTLQQCGQGYDARRPSYERGGVS